MASSPHPSALPPPTLTAPLPLNRPKLTYILIALLVVVYACELLFAFEVNGGGAPNGQTLVHMGGTIGLSVTGQGEWWRLFTAPLLHAGSIHILLNGIVLCSAGTSLERMVGSCWLGAIFCLSALAGSSASLLFHAPNIVGVGASGGIMGVLGALFVVSFRIENVNQRKSLQSRVAQTTVPALLPFVASGRGMNIDYAARGGGILIGAIVTYWLIKLWPEDRPRPPFEAFAGLVAGGYFLVAAFALVPILRLRGSLQ